jgi:hypothetical protein
VETPAPDTRTADGGTASLRRDVLALMFVVCLVVASWCALALARAPHAGDPAAPPATAVESG